METEHSLPELLHVELKEYNGVLRHSFEGLVRHLERHMDPSIADNILFFFLNGSRVYGTATLESDWDYACVTKRPTKETRKSQAAMKGGDELINTAKPFMLTESNVYDIDATLELYGLPTTNVPTSLRFDVSFYEIGVWKRLAFEQSMLPLEAQYLPSKYVLYKSPEFPTFVIDPAALKTTASLLGGLKFANARPRLDKEQNLLKAKKLGALGIRYLQFGIQLLESYRDNHGQPNITIWHALQPVWEELFLKHDPCTYAEFELAFRPTFKSYDTHLRQVMTYPTLYTTRENFSRTWTALRPTLVATKSIPSFGEILTPSWPDWLSSDSKRLLSSILMQKFDNGAPVEDSIATFHLFPSLSKCNRLLSLSLTCNAPIFENPFLGELNGMVIDLQRKQVLTSPHFGLMKDLVLLKPYLDSCPSLDLEIGPYEKGLIAFLESNILEVAELYDGVRVAVFFFEGEWHVSTVGGSINASERTGMRTTEGRGPPKSTVRDTFLQMLQLNTVPDSSHQPLPTGVHALDMLDRGSVYVFDMLSDASRSITANKPERIVFAFSAPLGSGAVLSTADKASPSFLHYGRTFGDLSDRITGVEGWRARLKILLDAVEYMNPFEQCGFEIRTPGATPSVKLVCRSYWSVKASLGHQNRVLAFNVAADHFEPESLMDVCIFGFRREFSATFPHWADSVEKMENERQSICRKLEESRAAYFHEKDRKSFANLIKDVPHPFKSILFEWYNFPFVSAQDILSSLQLGAVRQLTHHEDSTQLTQQEPIVTL